MSPNTAADQHASWPATNGAAWVPTGSETVVIPPVRILVRGGTSFVGRAIVVDAPDAGAEVNLFGRGKTGPDLFPFPATWVRRWMR
jgi:hypothetical protein